MRTTEIVRVCAFVSAATLASLYLVSPASAAADREPLADVEAAADLVGFQPRIEYRQVRVTVTGPEGFEVVASFDAGESPAVELPGTDGLYKYELRFSPVFDREAVESPDAEREGGLGGDKATDERTVQRGWFSLENGGVLPKLSEPDRKVVITNANGVIRSALCVGSDCPNEPNFGDSSVLMMEVNNRIKFGDTSTGTFPANDWEIEANSHLSGGASYLGFNDCGSADNDGDCAADLVFAVEAGVRQSALYVESDGDVGIGTSTPSEDIHVVTGDSPTLRLDQDGSSSFTPQVWDVAGNETNFFVRDVSSGSTLPFRILSGAPSYAVSIDVDGDVGLGTPSPAGALHVVQGNASFVVNAGANNADVVTLSSSTDNEPLFRIFETAAGGTLMSMFDSTANEDFRLATTGGEQWASGNFGLNCSTPNNSDFTIHDGNNAAGTSCNTGTRSSINAGDTTFTASSSRTIKQNLVPLSADGILEKLAGIDVYSYDFIAGQKDKIGLMAEDFHQVFGRGSDQVINGQEVQMALWLAVKELTERNRELAAKVAELEALQTPRAVE